MKGNDANPITTVSKLLICSFSIIRVMVVEYKLGQQNVTGTFNIDNFNQSANKTCPLRYFQSNLNNNNNSNQK